MVIFYNDLHHFSLVTSSKSFIFVYFKNNISKTSKSFGDDKET